MSRPDQSPLKVVFIGPPGAGKGTQAAHLKQDYCVCHLATGDMLRAAVASGSDIGKKAKTIMEKGELVPDEIMVGIIKDEIVKPQCKDGFILDGFPRTVKQAEKLDEMLASSKSKLDQAIEFAIEDNLVVKRIAGRRIHPISGRTYHVDFHPPKLPGRDDITGESLIQRDDDKPEVIQRRLQSYHQQTTPVLGYYKKQNILMTLDASQKESDVYNKIRNLVTKFGKFTKNCPTVPGKL